MAGGLVGILLFFAFYGSKTLDITYVDWLLAKGDMSQHYLGWEFFRKSNWLFPLGLCNNLSYPETSSVIFTDSIPLIAIPLKFFTSLLPEQCQFFGWYVLFAFFFQGAFAALIIYKITHNAFLSITFSSVLCTLPLFNWRVFTHVSLTSHYIILTCILLLLCYRELLKTNPVRLIFLWSVLSFLSTSTHFYFTLMVLLFCLAYIVNDVVTTKKISTTHFLTIIIPSIISVLTLYLYGGLSSEVQPVNTANSGGLGFFSANLNTFWNPITDGEGGTYCSSFLKNCTVFHIATKGQYEGFAYLGLGIHIILFFCIIMAFFNNAVNVRLRSTIKNNRTTLLLTIFLCIIFLFIALSPEVTFGKYKLFHYPIPDFISTVWSVFRATGRFIWPLAYLLLIGIFYVLSVIVNSFTKKGFFYLIFSLFLSVQFLDIVPWSLAEGNRKIEASYNPPSNTVEISNLMASKKHLLFCDDFIFSEANSLLFIAQKNNVSSNIFYFSRSLPYYASEKAAMAMHSFVTPSEECIYAFRSQNKESNLQSNDGLKQINADYYCLYYK